MMGAASSAVGKLLHGHANGYPAQRPPGQSRARILFYESTDPHYGFTNFSAHDVIYHGKRYPTSEHLFQAMKFIDTCPEVAEKIRTVSERPRDAFNEAHAYKRYQRADWLKVNIEMMDDVLLHKFTQHQDLKAELLGTGDAELIENSPYDAFWGNGKDKQGRNELGKALERLRSELRGF
ncbi:hypothetical protein B0H10DRAFT_2056247 [Mycena sp. CBHHK59/15]|nr:hypothetical protein B0H10DRAFT_2056247 [Mycena sp. CBHHK59/15]